MYGVQSATGIFFLMAAVEVLPDNRMTQQAGAYNADTSCIQKGTGFLQKN